MPQQIPVQYTGGRGFLGIGTETTFGTPVGATDYMEIDDGDDLAQEPGNTAIKTIRHSRASVSHFIQTGMWVEGGWTQGFFPTQGIRALAAALGIDTKTGSTGDYLHTLTCREDGLPSVTLEKGMGGVVNPSGTPAHIQSFEYQSCLIDEVTMTGAVDAPIKVAYKIIGQLENEIDPTSPSYTAEIPYSVGDCVLTIFGGTLYIVTGWEFTLKNNIQKEIAFAGYRYPALIYAGEREISGKLTLLMQDTVLVDDATEGTLGDLVIFMTTGANPQAEIDIYNVTLGKISKPLKIGKHITQEVPFTGSLQPGAAADIKALITNGYASAYV